MSLPRGLLSGGLGVHAGLLFQVGVCVSVTWMMVMAMTMMMIRMMMMVMMMITMMMTMIDDGDAW